MKDIEAVRDFKAWRIGEDADDLMSDREGKGNFKAIDAPPNHHAFGVVVWRMSGDERSPECEEKARFLVRAANSHADLVAALKSAHHMLTRDYIDDAKMKVIEKCEAAIAKAEAS